MLYRFVSFNKKVSNKGNVYAKVSFISENVADDYGVVEKIIYEPLISKLESFSLNFGDLVDIDVDLVGIRDFNCISSFGDSV